MAFIPVQYTAKAVMSFRYDDQICANVYYVAAQNEFPAESLALIGETMRDWWDTSLQSLVPQTVSLTQIDITDLTVFAGEHVVYTQGLPLVGTGGSTSLPNNVTVAVKWLTARGGRSFRGRTYHIGLGNTQVTLNQVTSAHLTNLQIGYSALIDAILDINFELCVVSLRGNNAWRENGIATPIAACTIEKTCDSQRRRLPGRGR